MTETTIVREEKWTPVYLEGDKDDYYNTPEWRRLRRKCLRRDNYKCQRCGAHHPYGQELTAHHIIPREEGGGDYLENLIALCEECHDLIEGRGLRSKAAIVGCPDLPSDLAGGGPIVEPEPDEGAKRPPPYNPNATLDLTLLSETLHVTAREQGEAKKRGKTQARAKVNPNLKRLALWVEAQKQYRTKEQTKWKRCRYFVRPSDSKVVAACRRITGRGYRDHLTVKPFETRYWRWDGKAKDWRYEKFSGETIWAKEICMRCGLFHSVKDVQEE